MSIQTVTQGRVAEPQLKFNANAKAILELRIAATHREKNRDSGEWGDVGDALWVSATFWGAEAERLAEIVHKGDQVTITGPLVLESYTAKDGTQRQKHVIRYPRFSGVIPKRQPDSQPAAPTQPQPDAFSQPSIPSEPPF